MKKYTEVRLTLLEKSRALPIGTRRIYGQGDKMAWFKKMANGKWEYDGQVSKSERSEEEKRQKAKARAKALKKKSKVKVADVHKQKADGTLTTKKKDIVKTDDKPAQAVIDKMPKRHQLYYDDSVTDKARELCNKTGILCMDAEAESYVESKLDTVFKPTKAQQKVLDELNTLLPTGDGIKWIEDPNFVEDTLEKLRELKKKLESDKYEQEVYTDISSNNPNMSPQDVTELYDRTKEDVDSMLLSIEMHENNKITLKKLDALDRGLRGIELADSVPTLLLQAVLPDVLTPNTYADLDDEGKKMLQYMGVTTEDQYRQFKRLYNGDVYQAAMLSVCGGNNLIDAWASSTEGVNRVGNYNSITINPGDPSYIDPSLFKFIGNYLAEKSPKVTKILQSMMVVENPDARIRAVNYASLRDIVQDNTQDRYSNRHTIIDSDRVHVKRKSETLTWRALSNSLKDALRAKSLKIDPANEETLQAFYDTARVLGNTSFSETIHASSAKIQTMIDQLSPALKEFVTEDVSRNYRSSFGQKQGAFTITNRVDSPRRHSSVYYRSATISKGGRGRYSSAPMVKLSRSRFAEKFGESKRAKAALRASVLSISNIKPESYGAHGLTSHGAVSIALAIGANWQNRTLAKKAQIIPDWKWGNAEPLKSHGIVPRKNGHIYSATVYSNSTNPIIGNSDYQTMVEDMRKKSIINDLGLTTGKKTPTSSAGKQLPKIVLKTNEKPISDWQHKLDGDWTHGGRFTKGSVKVKKVFDIMYHEYYDDKYKPIEQAKGNVDYMYHGTDFTAAASIVKSGFQVPRRAKAGRALGDGVYLAPSSSKSCGYLQSNGWGRYGTGVLLWNRVAKGKQNPTGNDYRTAMTDPSYDTVYLKGTQNGGTGAYGFTHDEYCVKDPKAVIPIQWIEVGT